MRLTATALALGFCFAVLVLIGSGFWQVGPAREAAGVAARREQPPPPISISPAHGSDRAGRVGASPHAESSGGRDQPAFVVRQGDSLWKLSHRILGKGFHYTEIYAANSAHIPNPHKIYPGQILVVPKVHGP